MRRARFMSGNSREEMLDEVNNANRRKIREMVTFLGRTLDKERAALGMNCAKLRVLQNADQVCLSGLMKGDKGLLLESQTGLEILGYFLHDTVERSCADEQIRGLLIATDFTKSNGARAKAMGFHYPHRLGKRFTVCLVCHHLSRHFTANHDTGCLLCTSHD
jgi:hypothetical protein